MVGWLVGWLGAGFSQLFHVLNILNVLNVLNVSNTCLLAG